MIDESRLRLLNDRPPRRGRYVLYWMQASQRGVDNPALERAVERADELGLPVLAVFGLDAAYPEANLRHFAFLVEGLAAARRDLERGACSSRCCGRPRRGGAGARRSGGAPRVRPGIPAPPARVAAPRGRGSPLPGGAGRGGRRGAARVRLAEGRVGRRDAAAEDPPAARPVPRGGRGGSRPPPARAAQGLARHAGCRGTCEVSTPGSSTTSRSTGRCPRCPAPGRHRRGPGATRAVRGRTARSVRGREPGPERGSPLGSRTLPALRPGLAGPDRPRRARCPGAAGGEGGVPGGADRAARARLQPRAVQRPVRTASTACPTGRARRWRRTRGTRGRTATRSPTSKPRARTTRTGTRPCARCA